VRSFAGKEILVDGRPQENRKIRVEYVLMTLILLGSIAASIAFGFVPLLLAAWILPALLVGEAAHYLIEMPEHFGLNTQTDPDVFTNTRTIRAGFLGQWYTNFNNLHTAHHSHPGVPMVNARELHAVIGPRVQVLEDSYRSFFSAVVAGEIVTVGSDETCMTR
jgi:fatty acid desaturase